MKGIENAEYYAWFHISLKPGVEQQIQAIYRILKEHPGRDLYDIVIENKEDEHRVLLTPQDNSFQYTRTLHIECEHLLGRRNIEVQLIKPKTAPQLDISMQMDSPIERAFWHEWIACTDNSPYQLIPQFPVGRYRIDFAHIPSRTAIELDGFATHSSTDDIANDRKRQREIESLGWHVIRFGGKEIHMNVGICVDEVYMVLDRRSQTDK